MKDFYYILGTQSNSTTGEISEAYNKLALKLKPALHEDDYFLQSRFRDISEAYEILSDPVKRSRYDAAFKRVHKKQLSGFKVNNLSLFAIGAFILFTGLFGFYVVRLVTAVKPVKAVQAIAAIQPVKIRHHKKKHHSKIVLAGAAKPVVLKKDTVPVAAKPAAIAAIKPVVIKPVPAPVDSSYITNLKPNLAGLVYLHQLDDYMSAVVTVLPHRSRIRVLEKGSNFYKVAFNNQVGYIPKWTISRP